MEEKKKLLSIRDLVVKFHVRGRVLTAIRGISLDIYENESIAIVGESGSGKSVFTKTFAGMLDGNGFIDQGKIVKELGAEELEAACRKCVRVEVSSVDALSRVLDAEHVEYEILSDNTADIYARMNVSQLAAALSEQGCELRSMLERDESLESYYMNLVGGERA